MMMVQFENHHKRSRLEELKRLIDDEDYLNGAVVRFGERVGVATPINRFLNETLKMIASQPLEANLYRKNVKKFIEDLSETVRLN